MQGDFLKRSDIENAVRGQERVFHFLSTTTPVTAENDPSLDVRTNIASSIDLFDACVAAGVTKVHFASTGGAIYGDQPLATLTEEVLPQPVSPYAIGKLAIEGYLRYFERKFGLRSVSYRISNPYGPRQHPARNQGVIPIFLGRLIEGRELTVYGDGSTVRDYIYVDDAVQMIGQVADSEAGYSVYNIGAGVGTSVAELLAMVERATGIEPAKETLPEPATFVHRSVLDITRYKTEFGTPRILGLEEGIRRTWESMKGVTA